MGERDGLSRDGELGIWGGTVDQDLFGNVGLAIPFTSIAVVQS